MTEPSDTDARAQPPSRLPLIAGAVAVAALLVVLIVLGVFGGDDDGEAPGGAPREVSEEELREFAAGHDQPVYWIGAVPGHKLELTRTSRGYVYVRYLPEAAEVGDRRPDYTTVASYPVANAYEAATARGRSRGRVERRLRDGGVVVYYRARPTSVYLAYPRSSTLVEVYDPQAREARSLVTSGRVQPVE